MANLSQLKREKMLAFLEKLKEQHTDDDSLIALGEIEKELKSKKYGLVWEEHEEAVDVQMKTQIPVFTEVKEKEICADENGAYNFLLEGDNLHSLYLLEKTHKGKIDVAYIDPPYNTKNKKFMYDDCKIGEDDGFRHSKWISFMQKRLSIAKNLLSGTGCIFISIDDNELYNLKLLCDEIFGEDNLIALMPRLTKKQGKNQQTTYASNHDYLMCYALNKNSVKFIKKEAGGDDYPLRDEFYEERGGYKLNQTLDYETLGYVNSLDYPITIENKTYYAGSVTETEYLTRKESNPKDGFRWRWSPEKLEYGLNNGFVVVKKSKNGTRIYTKTYFKAKIEKKNGCYFIDKIDRSIPPTSLEYVENTYSNDNAKKNFDALKLGKKFDYPKPVALIDHILSLFPKTSVVLDFFAGSGTTGQAVLQANQKDDGNRKFILCTNNQNDICTNITYPRIKTVITGKCVDGSEYSEGIPANLKYFKTDFVDKDSEDLSDELLNHIKEMIELEHSIKVDNQQYVIILTDEDMDKFEQNIEKYANLKAVFVNQDILLTATQQKLLDSINSYIIPDYYFDFELREAGELW